ncbi:ubiquitin carboxyl-terminal hydrolase 37-like isoform 2-T5 [Odontesthes bonariensis]|uniref:ubiquitin carboxyl-terminal hydrolase 37-like isoform X2 n=1 Tax=Odontesthes bonariensis TaxID=219752 RepID=UPI003F58EC76
MAKNARAIFWSQSSPAHEFLIAIMGQIRSLALPLQEMAAFVGETYICPVTRNLVFTMQNTRTCKSCGVQSITRQDYTDLSLDLIPGSSVEEMLQMYQKETHLEYRCKCGGNTSGYETKFLTLPKYLMFHLKRFKFTEDLEMRKLNDPIIIFNELVVTSSQAGGRYSLVSVINHLGSTVNSGHYTSEGLHPDEALRNQSDRWLHYDDRVIFETSRAVVREWRQKTCYVLFYQRQM